MSQSQIESNTNGAHALVANALQNLEQRRQFSPGVYTAPEIFELEKQKIFKRDWLPVGRVEEFENPGDYKAFRILDEPVVVSRDQNGELHALRNVCRHRGVEVATGAGNVGRFSCPYHGWVYELDGRLCSATYSEDIVDFDLKNCRLPSVRLETWAGFVFVNLDSEARSFRETHAEMLDRFAFLRLEDMKQARTCTIAPPCNWKLIVENVWDAYHLGVVHAASFAKNFNPRDIKFNLLPHGAFFLDYRSQSLAAPDGKSLFGTIPWLDVDEGFAFGGQLPPTLSIIARHDAVYTVYTEALGPQTCRFIVNTLLPAEWFERPDFEQKATRYGDFVQLVFQEDNDMLGSIQVGLRSEAFEPGPAVFLESPVHHFTKNSLKRLL